MTKKCRKDYPGQQSTKVITYVCDEISSKKWFSKQEYMELLKTNGTKDGVSILAILYALQFNPFEKPLV